MIVNGQYAKMNVLICWVINSFYKKTPYKSRLQVFQIQPWEQGWNQYNCNVLQVRSNTMYCKNKLQYIALPFTRIAKHFHCIIHIAIHFNCISLYCNTFMLYSVFIAIGNVMLIIKSRDNIFMTYKNVNVITIKTFYSNIV